MTDDSWGQYDALETEIEWTTFVGHGWLDDHNDVSFHLKLSMEQVREKIAEIKPLLERYNLEMLEFSSTDPEEIDESTLEKAVGGLVGDAIQSGELNEYNGPELEGNDQPWRLGDGSIQVWRHNAYYRCHPRHWGNNEGWMQWKIPTVISDL